MRTLILLSAIAFATGCMDFAWPDNQLNCSSNSGCPQGLFCDLEAQKCFEGVDPSGGEPCENASDCSAKECGLASCNAQLFCEWAPEHDLCGPGLLCSEPDYTCENALCPGASLSEPALLIDTVYNPYSLQLASGPEGYAFSYADHNEFGWTLADTTAAVTSTHKYSPPFAVGRHEIISLPDGHFAFVYQRENAGDWDVFLQIIDATGEPNGPDILISDEEVVPVGTKASYSPKAAFAPSAEGDGGTIAIAWIYADFADPAVSNRATWGAVYDVDSGAVSPSFPLVALSNEVAESAVTVFADVFISSAVTDNGKIYLRAFDSSGPKGGAPILVVAANAKWPQAIAWDGADTLGLQWRHMSGEGEITRFAAVTAEGSLAERLQNPIDLGPALDDTPDYQRTSADLEWAPSLAENTSGHWLSVFDAVPGELGGDQELAETYLAIIPAELTPLPTALNVSNYSVAASFAPKVALGQNATNLEVLIAWLDRRPFRLDADTDSESIPPFPQGIFFSILSCP